MSFLVQFKKQPFCYIIDNFIIKLCYRTYLKKILKNTIIKNKKISFVFN